MKLLLPLLLLAGLVQGTDSPVGAKAKEELKNLEGAWKVVSLDMGGKDSLPRDKGPLLVVIKGKQITLMGKTMSFKIDPTATPRALDLHITRGEESVDWKCIYAVKGDELKICMPLARKKGDNAPDAKGLNVRPIGFETEGRPLMLITAKRQEPK